MAGRKAKSKAIKVASCEDVKDLIRKAAAFWVKE